MSEPSRVSVVIPVFNAALSLPELISRLTVIHGSGIIHEVILVDDASRDDSWTVIRLMAAEHTFVQGIALAQNAGQHAALLAGIQEATGDVIVTMDDDLQHRPEDISVLLGALTPGIDLVYGRSVEEEHGALRNVTSRLAKGAIAAAAGAEAARLASGFRCFRSDHKAVLTEPRGPYVSLDVLLSWVSARTIGVPVTMEARRYGSSNYTTRRLIRHAINMLFGFSTAPLRAVSYAGFGVALLGLVLLLVVVVRALVGDSAVPGFAFTVSIVAVFSGVQLTALGVLGEYMARLYATSLKRPASVLRARTDRKG